MQPRLLQKEERQRFEANKQIRRVRFPISSLQHWFSTAGILKGSAGFEDRDRELDLSNDFAGSTIEESSVKLHGIEWEWKKLVFRSVC
ncbi:hypothetical protein GOP47_0004910 [Adiantum capillus-veneris]|uniref:Uncharacterized protein n=1 Tax=Adiantum capillus-veneris TaxID=13818 RepID=A0A9D4V4Y2_ADICA|nr:hypothetical protein GOP47_0004910 [Adiantum capillus-veneris]